MAVAAPVKTVNKSGVNCANSCNSRPWIGLLAAGTLAASGALLVSGKRRAGLVTAISGAVLAMIDQPEVVSKWWNALPVYLEDAQDFLGRAQAAVEDLTAQGEKLKRSLSK